MKVLFDTCVIVDSLQNREPFSVYSNNLLLAVANRKIKGYIVANSVTDIYYIMHRYLHDITKTKEILKKIFSLFMIPYTVVFGIPKRFSISLGDRESFLISSPGSSPDTL